jgi:hypothetical protein
VVQFRDAKLSCYGKRRISNQKLAKRLARDMREKYGDLIVEYHCPFCHQWHVGNSYQQDRKEFG